MVPPRNARRAPSGVLIFSFIEVLLDLIGSMGKEVQRGLRFKRNVHFVLALHVSVDCSWVKAGKQQDWFVLIIESNIMPFHWDSEIEKIKQN